MRTRKLRRLLCEPCFEADLAETRVFARKQGSLADFRSVVCGLWMRDDFARIFERSQPPAYQFIYTKLFRAADFDDAVYRLSDGNPGHAAGDIVGSHGLENHWRQMHFAVNHGNVGQTLEEFEELGCMHDGLGD